MRHSNFIAGLCLYLLAGLFAVNLYADEVTIEFGGGTYIGEVSNGVPNGQGTFTWSDGSKYVGEFKDGTEWNGTSYNADGTVKGTFSNGEWIAK